MRLFFKKIQKIGLFLGCFYAFFRVFEAKNTVPKECYFLCLFAAKFSLRSLPPALRSFSEVGCSAVKWATCPSTPTHKRMASNDNNDF